MTAKRKTIRKQIQGESNPIIRRIIASDGEKPDPQTFFFHWLRKSKAILSKPRKEGLPKFIVRNFELIEKDFKEHDEIAMRMIRDAFYQGDTEFFKMILQSMRLSLDFVDKLRSSLLALDNTSPGALTVDQMIKATNFKGDISDFRKILKELGIKTKRKATKKGK